jgi:hypothetical protein
MAVGEIGMSPSEFWKLSPFEFYWIVKGFQKRQIQKRNEMSAQAWVNAKLVRANKIPELSSILISEDKPVKPRVMTDEQMMAMAKVLNAAFGGEFVES